MLPSSTLNWAAAPQAHPQGCRRRPLLAEHAQALLGIEVRRVLEHAQERRGEVAAVLVHDAIGRG
jgi:hypothetical protein